MASKCESLVLKAHSRVAHLDRLLDEALEQTFPASDAIAVDVERPKISTGTPGTLRMDLKGTQ